METLRISPLWAGLLAASILCDVVATAYLKWAGDRFSENFLLANILSIVLFAPAIVTFGYALREDSSYLVTTLAWLVGLTLGVQIFGIVGLVMGPLLLSYFIVLMQVFARENAALRHLLPTTVIGKAELVVDDTMKEANNASEIRRMK